MTVRAQGAAVMCAILALPFCTPLFAQSSEAIGKAADTTSKTEPAPANATASEGELTLTPASSWVSSVALGARFLPDYGEDGRSGGFDRQQFFGLVTVDGRFGDDCGTRKDLLICSNPFKGPLHAGVSLALMGAPVQRTDKPSFSPNEFNDVANSVTGAGVGPINGIPEGYFRLSAARYEDYANLGRRTRLVGDAAFRIHADLDLYFGVQGNFGRGPDEIGVVLSMVREPKALTNLFTLGQ